MTKKTCLVVDDSSVVRKVCTRMLEDLDFDVVQACDGKVALEQCAKSMPDLILLDWNMPVMDGMAFLQEFRKNEKDVIVVFCTTESDIMKIQVALSEGANEYIMKPFDADILKNKLVQLGVIA